MKQRRRPEAYLPRDAAFRSSSFSYDLAEPVDKPQNMRVINKEECRCCPYGGFWRRRIGRHSKRAVIMIMFKSGSGRRLTSSLLPFVPRETTHGMAIDTTTQDTSERCRHKFEETTARETARPGKHILLSCYGNTSNVLHHEAYSEWHEMSSPITILMQSTHKSLATTAPLEVNIETRSARTVFLPPASALTLASDSICTVSQTHGHKYRPSRPQVNWRAECACV